MRRQAPETSRGDSKSFPNCIDCKQQNLFWANRMCFSVRLHLQTFHIYRYRLYYVHITFKIFNDKIKNMTRKRM